MITAPALASLLASGAPLCIADCYTIETLEGTLHQWTGADRNLGAFSCSGPIISRGPAHLARGMEVSTMDIGLGCAQGVTVGGVPLQLAAHNGYFDGATVKVERYFMPTWGEMRPGSRLLFEGNVAGVDPDTTTVTLRAKSLLELLALELPRNLFLPSCGHQLFDAGCGASRAAFTVSGIVTSGGTDRLVTNLAQADGWFNLGVVTMTSGAATGSRRAVSAYASGTLDLIIGLPAAAVVGDTFTVVPGCNRAIGHMDPFGTFIQDGDCVVKFNNLDRNRAFPFIPRNVMAR